MLNLINYIIILIISILLLIASSICKQYVDEKYETCSKDFYYETKLIYKWCEWLGAIFLIYSFIMAFYTMTDFLFTN